MMNSNIHEGLCMAIQDDDITAVEDYLQKGAEAHYQIDRHYFFSPWYWMYSSESILILRLLLENKADPNYSFIEIAGRTIIYGAIIRNLEAAIKLLVLYDADINVIDSNGLTPLYFAVQIGGNALNLIPTLLELGANICTGMEKIEEILLQKEHNLVIFSKHLLDYIDKLGKDANDFFTLVSTSDQIFVLTKLFRGAPFEELLAKNAKIREMWMLESELENCDSKGILKMYST
jgi:hypothetical protein